MTAVRRKLFDAQQLKWIAMGLMLLDHMWATGLIRGEWATWAGRMAFPIFAFQIAEGYRHTSDPNRYAGRLFLFALISEVPFDLMCTGVWFYPFHQNVMLTLLLGLLAIRCAERISRAERAAACILPGLGIFGLLLLGAVLFVDYSWPGVLTVLLFYLCRGSKTEKLWQAAFLIFLNQFVLRGEFLSIPIGGGTFELMTQSFAVGSLLFIWLYNGKKGKSSRFLQYFGYAFYPLHMLVLYLLMQLR